MPFPIEDKLVISVSSSALFDLSESDRIFKEKGTEVYRKYQEDNIDNTLAPGIAFPFIKRLLHLNDEFTEKPIEVILLSRNSTETGLRIFRSIQKHNLDITRAGFFDGASPFEYIPAFNSALFLSANEEDVKKAIEKGYPAGVVLKTEISDDTIDRSLRIAFDFDGVIVDDEAEKVYKETNDLNKFHQHEVSKTDLAHKPGILKKLVEKLVEIQEIENKRFETDKSYKKIINLAIITARNAPSHERMVTTLKNWGLTVNTTFFLGGIEKSRILKVMKPHIYFDDQMVHLDGSLKDIPLVHIPFGIANENEQST